MVGSWLYISLAMPFIRFFIPFFMLLCRPAKRNLNMIGVMAVWSLIVEYIDLYWVVMPVYYPRRSADALAGSRDAGGDRQRLRAGVLEPVPQAQDGSGGRSAVGAEPAF